MYAVFPLLCFSYSFDQVDGHGTTLKQKKFFKSYSNRQGIWDGEKEECKNYRITVGGNVEVTLTIELQNGLNWGNL